MKRPFDPHRKPVFFANKPLEVIPAYTEIARHSLYDGEDLPEKSLNNSKFKFEVDYGYYDDSPSYYLIEYTLKDQPNEKYEEQLKAYEDAIKQYKLDESKWEADKIEWDKEQARLNEIKERKLLIELKKKYDSKK